MRGPVPLRRMLIALAALVIALNPRPGSGGEVHQYQAEKVEPPAPLADFTLTGPDGKPYSLTSLRGKFVLLAFGFTHCPNVCPTTLANLGAAYDLLSPEERKRVQVLFITIDPARDSPTVLKEYVPFFNEHFIGLTGTAEEIQTVGSAYGVEVEKSRDWGGQDANYTMNHTAGAMVLSPTSRWIASYGNNQLVQSARVADDLRHFLALAHPDDADWLSLKPSVVKTGRLSGRELYVQQCASCHGENGEGVAGKSRRSRAPPG